MIKTTPSAFIPDDDDPDLDALEPLSNSVVDLIGRRRLDDAVKVSVELERRYPDQRDWMFRTAEVRDAKGELGEAIEHDRPCTAFIDANPDGSDANSMNDYRGEIDRLESRKRP